MDNAHRRLEIQQSELILNRITHKQPEEFGYFLAQSLSRQTELSKQNLWVAEHEKMTFEQLLEFQRILMELRSMYGEDCAKEEPFRKAYSQPSWTEISQHRYKELGQELALVSQRLQCMIENQNFVGAVEEGTVVDEAEEVGFGVGYTEVPVVSVDLEGTAGAGDGGGGGGFGASGGAN